MEIENCQRMDELIFCKYEADRIRTCARLVKSQGCCRYTTTSSQDVTFGLDSLSANMASLDIQVKMVAR